MSFNPVHKAFAELEGIPLPAESEWVPIRRSGPHATRAVAALALAALAAIAVVVALQAREAPLFERNLIPAAPAHASPSATPTFTAAVPTPGNNRFRAQDFRLGPHRVTVIVYENVVGGRRPVPSTPVNVWVDVGSRDGLIGYPLWFMRGGFGAPVTDANGQIELSQLEAAVYVFEAAAPGYVQPSAVIIDLRSDATVEIEIIPEAVATAATPQPAARGVTLSGVVYGTVDGVRRPVPGARVWVDYAPDVSMAYTVTDQEGRYRLYGMPARPLPVFASRKEYGEASGLWVDLSAVDPSLDLELKPRQ